MFARVLACLFLLLCGTMVWGQKKYVQQYKPIADSLAKVYGIPVKVILAVAIIESGSGTSRNCRLLNNHFGIVGPNRLLATHGIRTRYKQYADSRASYIDFAKLVSSKKYYAGLKGNTSEEKWVLAMSKSGYSEVPQEWYTVIMSTVKSISSLVTNN